MGPIRPTYTITLDADGGNQITTETVFTADNTMYAHWTFTGKAPEPPVDTNTGTAFGTTSVIAKIGDSTPPILLTAVMLACTAIITDIVWRKKNLTR